MSDRITVVVEGIDDAALVADVAEAIRASLVESAIPGPWRVILKPAGMGRRWEVNVYGVDVRHTVSVAVPPQLLQSLIPRRLRESLDRLRSEQLADPIQTHDPSTATTIYQPGPERPH